MNDKSLNKALEIVGTLMKGEQIEKSTDLWYIYQVMNLFIKGKGCQHTRNIKDIYI